MGLFFVFSPSYPQQMPAKGFSPFFLFSILKKKEKKKKKSRKYLEILFSRSEPMIHEKMECKER